MNNKFSDFVKKSKISTLSKLIGLFLLVIIVVLIAFVTKPIIVIPCFFVLVVIVFSITTNKERKQNIKYRLGIDIDNNIYIPLVLDSDYLNKVSSEFNNLFANMVDKIKAMIDKKISDVSIDEHLENIDIIKAYRKQQQAEIAYAIESHKCPRCGAPILQKGDTFKCYKCDFNFKL